MTTLGQALRQCTTIIADDTPVAATIAAAMRAEGLTPAAAWRRYDGLPTETPALRIGAGSAPGAPPPPGKGEAPWAFFRYDAGAGELTASAPYFLYALYTEIRDHWACAPATDCTAGRWLRPRFTWLTGRDELLTGRLGFLQRRRTPVGFDDIDADLRELARLGCSHVVVNELAQRAFETGPAGEVYYRFYDYTPDIDQYVETPLNAGTYPREYLQANLDLLRRIAAAADGYGLIPGLYSAHPRSVPEHLLARYPHLRGARIDHPFRSYLPRYTLTVAHPAVRWHYAELIRALLREVPQLGFIKMLLNDSGSGFEFTSSLYPGRNGGPYIVREWRPDAEVARLAAANVIGYYRSLRDAARSVNPDFHLMTGLKNIAEEQAPILAGMDTGIDLQTQSQRSDVDDPTWEQTRCELRQRGAHVLSDTHATGSWYILGVPSPWWTAQRLLQEADNGCHRIDVYLHAAHFAPWDPNREIVRAVQLGGDGAVDVDAVVDRLAAAWCESPEEASNLIEVWRQADLVARGPCHFLHGDLGFTWYRWWVRPFVPDVAAIPEAERAYYEEPMLTVFNNPNHVDFAADALWNLQRVDQADDAVRHYDEQVLPPLSRALDHATRQAGGGRRIWVDLRDRLHAFRCYLETLRNLSAWVAGVHGYLQATDEPTRRRQRAQVAAMVERELANAVDLLALWHSSDVDFMPLQTTGESVHHYGMNFGDLVQRKIDLMRAYGDREPRIDPNYMFRAPAGFPIPEEEYLRC